MVRVDLVLIDWYPYRPLVYKPRRAGHRGEGFPRRLVSGGEDLLGLLDGVRGHRTGVGDLGERNETRSHFSVFRFSSSAGSRLAGISLAGDEYLVIVSHSLIIVSRKKYRAYNSYRRTNSQFENNLLFLISRVLYL